MGNDVDDEDFSEIMDHVESHGEYFPLDDIILNLLGLVKKIFELSDIKVGEDLMSLKSKLMSYPDKTVTREVTDLFDYLS